MVSMPPDAETRKDAGPAGESQAGGARRASRSITGIRGFSAASARLLDYLAVEEKRRRRTAVALSVALNVIVLGLLAVYGTFRIWIPSTPGDSGTIIMVDLPLQPVLTELEEPELAPLPEPEPAEEPLVEIADALPEAVGISRAHKDEMTDVILQLLPTGPRREALAQGAALAFDGAIVRAQMAADTNERRAAAETLRGVLRALVAAPP